MAAAAGATVVPVRRVLILGGEGAGKTTLAELLVAVSRGAFLDPTAIEGLAPTIGQELFKLELPLLPPPQWDESGLTLTTAASYSPAARAHDDDLIGAVGDSAVGSAAPAAVPSSPPAGRRQPGPSASMENAAVKMEIKEFGGAMMPAWPRLLKGSDNGRACIFVMDASNPFTFATTAMELHFLYSNMGFASWKVLIAINKFTLPSAMSPLDVVGMAGIDALQRQYPRSDVAVLAVDTWSGEGVEQAYEWIRHVDNSHTARNFPPNF